jgi:transcription initiation factor TFIID subunit TAF12
LEDDQLLLYGTQTYRSTITNNARDAINKQIKEYTNQITNIDLTQIEEMDDIILPHVQFHNTEEKIIYLKSLAEDLSPIMNKEMIDQWDDKTTDQMLIAGSILLFLLITGTMTILAIYYFKNKKGLVWISHLAKHAGITDAAEFIKTLTYKIKQVDEPQQQKSVEKQFQDAQGTIDQAISQIQSTTQQQRAIALSSFQAQPSPIRVASQPQLNYHEPHMYPRLLNPAITEGSTIQPPGYIHTA